MTLEEFIAQHIKGSISITEEDLDQEEKYLLYTFDLALAESRLQNDGYYIKKVNDKDWGLFNSNSSLIHVEQTRWHIISHYYHDELGKYETTCSQYHLVSKYLFNLLDIYGETVGEYNGSLVWGHCYEDIRRSYIMSQIYLENFCN